MKRVSFEVAKAIKEAGYPQDYKSGGFTIEGYKVNPKLRSDEKVEYSRPTYFEVWLWLWREKNIRILFDDDYVEIPGYHYCEFQKDYTDPEKAIIAAIEYVVKNNLFMTKNVEL